MCLEGGREGDDHTNDEKDLSQLVRAEISIIRDPLELFKTKNLYYRQDPHFPRINLYR